MLALRSLFAAGLLVCLTGCSMPQEESLDSSTPAPVSSSAKPAIPEKKEEPKYFYPYAQKRDPFESLLGAAGHARNKDEDQDLSKGDIGNLELKGILQDKRGKVALISSTFTGEPYTLRSGRVYDRKNRVISGVSGIIKENSVVLITQNRTVRELTLNQKETAPAVKAQ